MGKGRKPRQFRPGPSTLSSPQGKAATGPTTREVRVDRKALGLVMLAGALVVPVLLGLKAVQDRSGRSALLAEAKKQRDVAKRPDLALGYFGRYLELSPDDLDAMDQRAALLAEVAREPGALNAAIQAHTLLLGKPPGGPDRGPARKRLAGLYLRSGQFRAAELAAREYLRFADGKPDAEGHRLLARSLEGIGRLGEARALEGALAEYEAAEAIEPGDVASAERLAALYLDKFNDRAKAGRVLDAMLEHNPKSSRARLARSRFFASTGDSKAASAEVEAAIRLDPSDLDARLAAAEAAARRGDPGAARAHLAAIRPDRPDDVRIKIIQGLIELDERDPDAAIESWRAGLVLAGGSDAELSWRLAHVLIQLGRVREADPLLAQYRRLSGGEEPPTAYRYLVGLAALRSGRTAEAVLELEAIRFKLDKGLESQLYLALGQGYEAMLEPSKAADAFARAAASAGAGATPWLELARLQAVDRPDDAIATLDRGISGVGPDPRLVADLARAHWRRQLALPAEKRNWAELEQVFERAKATSTGSADLAIVRADHASTLGQHEDALAILEAATAKEPGNAPLWLAQAEALSRLGREAEVPARLDRAIGSAGDQASFRIAKARVRLKKGEVKAARSALVDGLDRVPAGQKPALWKAIGEFHQSQGDRPAARLAFLEWASARPDAIEPRLSLLNLAIESGDGRAIDAEVEALKAIGGPGGVSWKIARAEALLRDRPGPPPSAADLEEAARLVDEVEAATPRQPAGFLLEGRLRQYRGQVDPAILAYQKAIDLKGGPLAVAPLVTLLAGLGRFDELEALRSKLGGFSPEIERMAGALVLRRGSLDKAEELARRMVEGDPTGLDARAWQARVLGDLGRPAEAERSLRQLIERRPGDPAAWVQLLMFQVARKDSAAASATIDAMDARVKADRPELLRALCLRAAGLRSRADRAFDEAIKAHPDELATLRSAIDYYEATGRGDRAAPLLRRAFDANPGLDWLRRRLALGLAARPGDRTSWSEALRLAGASGDGSDTPDDRLTRAVVLSLGPEDRRPEAVAILEKLAADLPDNARVRESLARALLGVGDAPKAREHATRAASSPDASPESLRLAAALDLSARDPDAASRHLDRLASIAPDDPPTLELRARVLKAQGKPKEAVAALEKAFEAAGGSIDLGRSMIRLLTSMDEPDAAERLARKVASLGPPGSIVLAELLGSRGRFDEAAAAYEDASKDRPSARDAARSSLAMASMTREPRWLDLADRLADRAAAGGPVDDELIYARASLRHLQGRLDEAVKLYDELAARSPSNILFLNNCAWILSEDLGRPLEGLNRIEALIARSGGQPHALDTRGVILLRLGRVAPAIADLEAAAASIPSAPICYHLARAYLAANRPADASRTLGKAKVAGLKAEALQPSERDELARIMATIE